MKYFYKSLMIMVILVNFAMASDDILEEIGYNLEQPKVIQKKEPYFKSLYKSMTNKDSYVLYKEVYLSSRYSKNLDQFEGKNSLGLLLFGTFSGPEGQIGDMNIQLRAVYYSNQISRSEKTCCISETDSKKDELKFELHNAYLKFKLISSALDLKIGHFSVPYGMQSCCETHNTLLCGPAMALVGLDMDWGSGFEGQNRLFGYQLALTRGSGMDYFERDNNYVIAGRLTPKIGENNNFGISFLKGKIFDPIGIIKLRSFSTMEKESNFMGNIVKKWRVGLDGQKAFGPLKIKGEVSTGKDAGAEDVLSEFAEINYFLSNNNRWLSSLQFENLSQDYKSSLKKSDSILRGGLTYTISANYNLQLVVSKDLGTIFREKDTLISLLFYGLKG